MVEPPLSMIGDPKMGVRKVGANANEKKYPGAASHSTPARHAARLSRMASIGQQY
jgi:hypothetical protein